jgi:pantoate kinase
MAASALAFCPGHISGYFRQVPGTTPSEQGSTGAGVVISEGVHARVHEAPSTTVAVRLLDAHGDELSVESGSAPVEYVLSRLGITARVTTSCRLPIGAGFGMSAAAILATATAADALFDLGMGPDAIAALAHETEIVCQSGLGDVAACRGGGLACRTGPGIKAAIERCTDISEQLHAISFGPIPTASVLSSESAMERVRLAYPGRCPRDLEDFFSLSLDFTRKSGLAPPRVLEVLDRCRESGVPASMTMLGEGVFSFGESGRRVLTGFGRVITMEIAREGVRLLEVRR